MGADFTEQIPNILTDLESVMPSQPEFTCRATQTLRLSLPNPTKWFQKDSPETHDYFPVNHLSAHAPSIINFPCSP